MNSKLLLLLTFTALLAICIEAPNPKKAKGNKLGVPTKPQHKKDKEKHDKKVQKKEDKKTKVDQFENAIKHAIAEVQKKSHHSPNDLAEVAIKTAMELEAKEINASKKTHPKANVLAEMLKGKKVDHCLAIIVSCSF
jgi:septal ring factor EnvC (AmiA/AmiB activator)